MQSAQCSALGGTLIRLHKNLWAWSDDSPAPLVYDLTASQFYKFRIRGRRWVEALVQTVKENQDLHWIAQAGYKLSLSGYHYGRIIIHPDGRMTRTSLNGKVIPQVYLVPLTDWNSHDYCVAAQWSHRDHEAIIAKASSLGCLYSID
jgi:hypothetical protein